MTRWVSYVQLLGAAYDLGTYPTQDAALARAREVVALLSEPAAACARRGGDAPDARLGAELGKALCGIQPTDKLPRRLVLSSLWRGEIAAGREMRRRAGVHAMTTGRPTPEALLAYARERRRCLAHGGRPRLGCPYCLEAAQSLWPCPTCGRAESVAEGQECEGCAEKHRETMRRAARSGG